MSLFIGKKDEAVKERILAGETKVKLGNPKPLDIARRVMVFIIGVLFVILVWYLVAWYYNTFMMYAIKFPNPEDSFKTLNRLLTHLIIMITLQVVIFPYLSDKEIEAQSG